MLHLIASLVLAQAAAANAAHAPPSPCASEAHAAFDFWVGEWDVYPNGTDRLVAHSSIQRLANGCTVREEWMPLRGGGGTSLNVLDIDSGRWHQNWIGSDGTPVHFEGGRVAESMVLTGYWANVNGPGMHGLIRMTYTPQEDGSVRQHGELSTDHGLNWSDSFDFIYKPRAE